MAKKSLTDAQKERIYQLSEVDGFSQTKIAQLYDVSQATIHNAIKDKRHEVEIAQLKGAMENAMTRGVKAVIEEHSISLPIDPHYLEDV